MTRHGEVGVEINAQVSNKLDWADRLAVEGQRFSWKLVLSARRSDPDDLGFVGIQP
jgi:hypothetical protein